MDEYVQIADRHFPARLPLTGKIDLTYRCNNNCRHCWSRIPPDRNREREINFDEIRKIVDEARKMGCNEWVISGGEPMIREDFSEIFDYLSSNSLRYSINTNGTLITPYIARLMKRKGAKMIALYGATDKIHDHITKVPGSFDATMRGVAYLREAGAGFMFQIIPMRDNAHEFKKMVQLAESVAGNYRVGISWLHLSAGRDTQKNREIKGQRLSPLNNLLFDTPDIYRDDELSGTADGSCRRAWAVSDDRLFVSCIMTNNSFHLDPYGGMSLCPYIEDPAMRYNMREGSFPAGWESFIPSLAYTVKDDGEYRKNCACCPLRHDCQWCPAMAYLESGRFTAKVPHLCAIARKGYKYKEHWKEHHRRFFKIGDITIRIDSDLPFKTDTFHAKFALFQTEKPGEDLVSIRHHFSIPLLQDTGSVVYRKAPWVIYRKKGKWIYVTPDIGPDAWEIQQVAVFKEDYSQGEIYNRGKKFFTKGGLQSLTLFPTDQIFIAQLLSQRGGCYMHAAGAIMNGRGLLFVGHSEAGKSTVCNILKGHAEILCDDRIILRKTEAGYRIFGTWSHGDVPDISAADATLTHLFFLEKSEDNKLVPVKKKSEIVRRILPCIIQPLATEEWLDRTLSLVKDIIHDVPCYRLQFDRHGGILTTLAKIL